MKAGHSTKRQADLQTISEWIEAGSRVLDLGCGRGVLLEHLRQKGNVQGLGVDIDNEKIEACVRKGVPAYQGDAETLLSIFDEGHFDWVILSRTVQELDNPGKVIEGALRAGRMLAVGFSNHGYWNGRPLSDDTSFYESSESGTGVWPHRHRQNPLSISEFEDYCAREKIDILRRACLASDWKTPVTDDPEHHAAYALYAISRKAAQAN